MVCVLTSMKLVVVLQKTIASVYLRLLVVVIQEMFVTVLPAVGFIGMGESAIKGSQTLMAIALANIIGNIMNV